MSRLLEPVVLGDLKLSNRIVMAVGARVDEAVEFYARHAGAGLIVTEGVSPGIQRQGDSEDPRIQTGGQVAGWRSVADDVHDAGGCIVMLLTHPGRAAEGAVDSVAPSAVRCETPLARDGGRRNAAPRALEAWEIREIVQGYRRAALNAVAAGMDGVELDAAGGHLPMQFLSTNSNLREDVYGGSSLNRCRFVLEVMQAMGEAIGYGRVAIRINPGGRCNDMADAVPAATYSTLLRELSGRGFAYVHLIHRPQRSLDTLMMTRGYWSGPVMLGTEGDIASAAADVTERGVEAVAFQRPFIVSPERVVSLRA